MALAPYGKLAEVETTGRVVTRAWPFRCAASKFDSRHPRAGWRPSASPPRSTASLSRVLDWPWHRQNKTVVADVRQGSKRAHTATLNHPACQSVCDESQHTKKQEQNCLRLSRGLRLMSGRSVWKSLGGARNAVCGGATYVSTALHISNSSFFEAEFASRTGGDFEGADQVALS